MFANDPLTGSASTSTLRAQAYERLRVGDVKVATVNLRGFADYNARRGYLEGDLLLRRTAEFLRNRIDAATTLYARAGGRFLVLMLADKPEPDLSSFGDLALDVSWLRIRSAAELDALLAHAPSGTRPAGSEGRDFII